MMMTNRDARNFIQKAYPEMKFRITSKVTIGVRPNYETILGIPTLCWRKLDKGNDSVVKIGILLSDNSIDWNVAGFQHLFDKP